MTGEFELRTTSDAFLARLSRLHELESIKRELVPGTPEMVRVTREVEALSAEVLDWARRQTELSELAAKRQPSKLRPIAIVPPRDIPTILGEWRDAERSLSAETPGTAAWESVRADVERLRGEYGRAFAVRQPDAGKVMR
jgi:hypothetical protein